MSSATLPRRREGRPTLDPSGERGVELRFTLPVPGARAVAALAAIERVTAADICRRAMTKYLRDRQRTQSRLARRVELTRGRIGL